MKETRRKEEEEGTMDLSSVPFSLRNGSVPRESSQGETDAAKRQPSSGLESSVQILVFAMFVSFLLYFATDFIGCMSCYFPYAKNRN